MLFLRLAISTVSDDAYMDPCQEEKPARIVAKFHLVLRLTVPPVNRAATCLSIHPPSSHKAFRRNPRAKSSVFVWIPEDHLVARFVIAECKQGPVNSQVSIMLRLYSTTVEFGMVRHGVLDEGMDVLSKPFTRSILTQKVRQVLNSEPIVTL